MAIPPQIEQALKQAKQKGLISNTQASIIGQSHSGRNEPIEPIHQTLNGIISLLIMILLLLLGITATVYFLS